MKETTQKYFAYGSNCNPSVLQGKGVAFTSRRRAILRGYRLLFNKKSLRERLPDSIGFPNINEFPTASVEGVLYELAVDQLSTLDESERCPEHYERIEVTVETELGSEDCWTYRAQPQMIAEGLVPSRNYVNHILAGREFLSRQYLEALDQSRTYEDDCACCHRRGEVLFVRERDHLHTLCQPCQEARSRWSDAYGRSLTVAETEAVMTELVQHGPGFESVADLVKEAVERNLIRP